MFDILIYSFFFNLRDLCIIDVRNVTFKLRSFRIHRAVKWGEKSKSSTEEENRPREAKGFDLQKSDSGPHSAKGSL